MKYLNFVSHQPDMMRFMYERTQLDLRGQPLDGPNWFCVTVRDAFTGDIAAALACEFKTWFDVSFSAAIDQPEAITRQLLFGLFSELFSRARRITALVEPGNDHAEDVVKRLGFVYEGFVRRGLDGERDALLYGMLPQDCNFLPGVRAVRSSNGGDQDGQPAQIAGPLRHRVGATERQRRFSGGQRYN